MAELLGFLEVVGGEQNRGALLVQPADVAPQLDPQFEVDPGGRLVQNHQPRLVHQRPGEQQSPAHSARQARRPYARLGAQIKHVHHLARPSHGLWPAHPVVAAVVHERLLNVEEAVEIDVLLGQAHHPPCVRIVVGQTENVDLARRDPDQVANRADQRRLTRAVGAQQPEELAVRDLQIELVERQEPAVVALGQPAQGQCR